MKIALVGTIPPPYGGVNSSVKSIACALGKHNHISVKIIDPKSIWKIFAFWPDAIHYNFTKPYKRFLATVIGKLVGAKVIHTIDGNYFDFVNTYNSWTLRLSDKFILLNESIHSNFASRLLSCNICLMTPILAGSSYAENQSNPIPLLPQNCFKKSILVYANQKVVIDRQDIYGFPFIASLLPDLDSLGITVIYLDPSNQYSLHELDPSGSNNLVHITHPVNFTSLCREVSIYCRPTSTDGNSVAIWEALGAGIPVLASNAVPRPHWVQTYCHANKSDFLNKIRVLNKALSEDYADSGSGFSGLSTDLDYINFISRV